MTAQERYQDCNGDFYAAGITYYTVFALFPLLMVGFAAGGFLLASRPDLLAHIEDRIRESVSGDFGHQLISLIDSAINSRGTVGVIGLLTAAWAGLGWMANLRKALTEMWEQQRESDGFVRNKLSDLVALVSTFIALALTIALTVLGDPALMTKVLNWLGLGHIPHLGDVLGMASLVVSFLVAWMLFTWIIARLPRESVSLRSSVRAALIAAVGFEIFKQLASILLRSVMHGPAGATFGPVLGLMVFAFVTARLLLFSTAWAATSKENLVEAPIAPPGPAVVITTRHHAGDGVDAGSVAIGAAVGFLGALGLSWLVRRR
ncbi:inner membrane protein YhjD [Mycobacterium sp. OTB74]|uniref:inner membrane protein YhjD n=1 Tax=Mycobacterium sp. OTB74 TaxID=1853452 RepID=UPI002476263B|nr:inner membrane protein YhjD [Mycobacterium sp. OTB74]